VRFAVAAGSPGPGWPYALPFGCCHRVLRHARDAAGRALLRTCAPAATLLRGAFTRCAEHPSPLRTIFYCYLLAAFSRVFQLPSAFSQHGIRTGRYLPSRWFLRCRWAALAADVPALFCVFFALDATLARTYYLFFTEGYGTGPWAVYALLTSVWRLLNACACMPALPSGWVRPACSVGLAESGRRGLCVAYCRTCFQSPPCCAPACISLFFALLA